MIKKLLFSLVFSTFVPFIGQAADWQLGPFERVEIDLSILPQKNSVFFCPVQKKLVCWESVHVFNPGAVVQNGKIYLFYRAEDDFGTGIGYHTSRIGLASSSDGIQFQRGSLPVLFPQPDHQISYEFPGGCEDPRIVETEKGTYVMTYTQWNRQLAVLGIATSKDLLHWKKRGYAFEKTFPRIWSKSGSIVCRCENDHLIATKILGKYWMYWGEGFVYAAVSDDLISWTPLLDEKGQLFPILAPREGKFDSLLVEAGPPAILTQEGIVFIYNGKNSSEKGDPKIAPDAYSVGQALFDKNNPKQILDRTDTCFLTPKTPWELTGQYKSGTVFAQGLVHFKNQWFLYYGTADSGIGVAKTP